MCLKICVIATFFLFLLHEKRLKHSFDCVTYWKKEALCSFLQAENLGNFHNCKDSPEANSHCSL